MNNRSQRMNNANSKNESELLEKIRALGFVKVELELFLDTHPNNRAALEMYSETIEELEELTELYNNLYGPLVASQVKDGSSWTWVNKPWPWHHGDESRNNAWKGEDD